MAKVPSELVEGRGRWVLPVAGGEVTQVQIDFAFGLVIQTYDDRHASVHVRISTPLQYENGDATTTIDPEHTAHLAPLITLHKATVDKGFVVKDGHLVLRFADGRAIFVAPHDQYEAWHVTGHLPPIERKFELIAVPSGGIAKL